MVTRNFGSCVKRLCNYKMDIAIFCMAKNDRIIIAMFFKEFLQISNCIRQVFYRKSYVFKYN
ncbi:hypothetical protein D3C78_1557450 [compost metagenome]